MRKLKLLSIIVSVYNEEKVIDLFWKELYDTLKLTGYKNEIIFINDGSIDNSLMLLKIIAETNNNVHVINFSRNFGHEAAMIAGIDKSSGDAIICMDSDLQHPPSLLKQMVEKYCSGSDIVMMTRISNQGAGLFNKIASGTFYKLINKLSPIYLQPNASDFFLISNRVSDILKNEYRERIRFLRGFIQMAGFSKTSIDYIAPRRIAGESKYSFFSLVRLSISSLAIISNIPLHIGVIFGVIVGIFSFILGIFSIVMKIIGFTIPGYTTIIVVISFLFAMQFFLLGIIGEYIGFLFTENKKRPLYIIESIIHKKRKIDG